MPLAHRVGAMAAVVFDKLLLRLPEFSFEFPELARDLIQLRVRQEVAQPVQEREGVGLDYRMSAALEKTESAGRFLRQETFMAEAYQTLETVLRLQAQIFGFDFFVPPPVADTHVDKNALACEHVEERRVC